MSWKEAVVKNIETALNKPVVLISLSSVGGGDINDAYRFKTNIGDFFVKKNSALRYPSMFQKEAKGLVLLAATKEIVTPKVVTVGEEQDTAWLILIFVNSGVKDENFWNNFGNQLASLHLNTSVSFGLDEDNYIGSLRQSNTIHNNWSEFFRSERLDPQLKIARDNGLVGLGTTRSFDRFYNKLDEIFPVEPAALLHGDLWSGNFMVDENGAAMLIDPAVYYGHREMDLGMSKLFGGFDERFYESYHSQYPLEKGWQKRLEYCNLYPLMVHVNLFGGGYLGSVKSILRKF